MHQQEGQYEGYTGSTLRQEPLQHEERSSFQQQERIFHAQQQLVFTSSVQPETSSVLAAVLSYTLFWFTGLVFALFSGSNRYVRFHALQSLIFFGTINVLDIGLTMFMAQIIKLHLQAVFPFTIVVFVLSILLLQIVGFIGWLVGMFYAARGTYYTLPFVGKFVLRYVNQQATVK